jgi:hypothetical protein
VAAALDQDRVPAGRLVEFGRGGHAALGQVEFLPVGGGADPLALGGDLGPLPDQVQELGDGVGLVDGNACAPSAAKIRWVWVSSNAGSRQAPEATSGNPTPRRPADQHGLLVQRPGASANPDVGRVRDHLLRVARSR